MKDKKNKVNLQVTRASGKKSWAISPAYLDGVNTVEQLNTLYSNYGEISDKFAYKMTTNYNDRANCIASYNNGEKIDLARMTPSVFVKIINDFT